MNWSRYDYTNLPLPTAKSTRQNRLTAPYNTAYSEQWAGRIETGIEAKIAYNSALSEIIATLPTY